MSNNDIRQGNWMQRHLKWFVPTILVSLLLVVFFSSGLNKMTSDLTLAYSDTELYSKALEKVNTNETVKTILGDIEPIDQLAILEGQVNYSEDNTKVKSSIRIIGTKGKAKLDIITNKVETKWIYKTIVVRIKQPKDQQQTITILSED
ncbi:cytochrome c oxidase assembly factor Coa1 family protein [Psychroserpens mesophilus]|uniref:cytochrome c oxidase assembly factor Coa1 family protein n=1 Tax=Psychroserpens mesophilus TaxID=325473 RepID=UPI00058CE552|nr:cytochrome c oxidase assembly factor Coa1 family protein [Psychroserpens mesophilus]